MSKSNASVDISDGIEYENPIPQMIPVTIDAEPNIPAMDAYSGSTHLEDNNSSILLFMLKK